MARSTAGQWAAAFAAEIAWQARGDDAVDALADLGYTLFPTDGHLDPRQVARREVDRVLCVELGSALPAGPERLPPALWRAASPLALHR